MPLKTHKVSVPVAIVTKQHLSLTMRSLGDGCAVGNVSRLKVFDLLRVSGNPIYPGVMEYQLRSVVNKPM
jgi:hypothetical protein